MQCVRTIHVECRFSLLSGSGRELRITMVKFRCSECDRPGVFKTMLIIMALPYSRACVFYYNSGLMFQSQCDTDTVRRVNKRGR